MTEALQMQAKAEASSTVHARLPGVDNKLARAGGLQGYVALQRKPLAVQPPLIQAKSLAGHNIKLAQRQAEPEEEEDEKVQAKRSDGLIQREEAAEEEEEKVQAKLKIGPPDDEYEREADRVADQVMSMPEPKVQRKDEEEEEELQTKPLAEQITPLVRRQVEPDEEEEEIQTKPLADQITPLVQRQVEPDEEEEEIQTKPLADQITPLVRRQVEPDEEEEEIQTKPLADQITSLVRRQVEPDEEEEEIQTKPLANQITPLVQRQTEPEDPLQTKQSISQTPRLVPRFGSSIRSMRGNGQALSQSERAFFEPTFGHDFSRVKVHTSPQAAKAAQAINAQAFTLGNDIFFGPGRYMPETSIGKGLLAHELVHVIQQREHDDLISRSMVDDRRKEIVDTALGLTEEHYLMGAAGQIPDKGGGVNARNVIMNSSNHAASIDVDYGKKKGGKKTHVCAGRSEKAASLPQADPKNEEHHKNPSKYKWKRISDGSAVFGEACELKNHFDCGGFISYCYKKVCPEVKYPGDVINLLSASYGWTKVDKEQVQPGDIAYREGQEHGHHAGLCISSDKVISALGKKWGVQSEPTSKYQKFGHLGCLKEQEEKKSGGIHRKELAYKSQPNNMYEQEAEQMADLVMRMPELRVQRQVEPKEREIREKNWRDIKNSIHKKINDHVKLYPELEKFRNDLRKILETIAAKYLDPSHMSSQEKAGIWALRQLDVKEWTYESTSPSRGTAEIGKEYKCNKFIADAFGFGAGLGYGTQKGYPTKLHERLLGLYKRIYPYVANELADPKGQIANFPVIAYKDYTEKSPKDIDMNKLKFGDVVAFYNPNYKKKKQLPGHCGIYLGSGLYISAGATKGGYIELVANQEPPKRKDHSITTYRRYTPR